MVRKEISSSYWDRDGDVAGLLERLVDYLNREGGVKERWGCGTKRKRHREYEILY